MSHRELIFDWNRENCGPLPKNVEICDETLRDGLQSPSVVDPAIEKKLELVSLMAELQITIADIGLPAASRRAFLDVLAIAQYVAKQKLSIKVNCAARTLRDDIKPIAEIQERTGLPITAYCFLGTSPIRQMVENWDLKILKKTMEDAVVFARSQHLKVAFVTEDTIRSDKETLKLLFAHAIDLGVERLVLCDTVGHATPDGVRALIAFTKQIIANHGQDVNIDWHGHNDRGLAVINALIAAQAGCHRIHGTALGIGERVGNTAIDQLLVNLKLQGIYPFDLETLMRYVETAARICEVPIPHNYPVFGKDAFRTATGVHAAAVIKAQQKGDQVLANTIYSGVPAHWFGKKQVIEVGPMSGASNVRYWLSEHGFYYSDSLVKKVLDFAKKSSSVLKDEDLTEFVSNLTNIKTP